MQPFEDLYIHQGLFWTYHSPKIKEKSLPKTQSPTNKHSMHTFRKLIKDLHQVDRNGLNVGGY